MKKYKILGDSFKKFLALSSNMFEWDSEENRITKENIQELIENADDNLFIYDKHKLDPSEEREPIGKITNLESAENEIGLYADIEWTEKGEEIANKKGFFPSVEFFGRKGKKNGNVQSWENLSLKAVALVEQPASRGVDLICASAMMIENTAPEEGKGDKVVLEEKIKEIMTRVKAGDTGAREEFIELLDENKEEFVDSFMAMWKEPETPEEPEEPETPETSEGEVKTKETIETPEGKEEVEVKEELSAMKKKQAFEKQWQEKAELHAVALSGQRCSVTSVNATMEKAYRFHKAGEPIDSCFDLLKKDLDVLGIVESSTTEVNLSGLSKEELEEVKNSNLAKAFEGRL